MQWIGRVFLRGIVIVLPIVLTIYILIWLALTIESALSPVLTFLLPDGWYRPGLGVALGVAIIFGIGVLAGAWLFRKLGQTVEGIIQRIPLIKTIYGSVRDMMDYFSKSQKSEYDQVVLVAIPQSDMKLVGFITRDDMTQLPEGLNDDDRVTVYLPMSYQIGGYTVHVARDQIRTLNMNLEDAMRFILTAGVQREKSR